MSNTKVVMGQAANTLVKPLNVEDVFSTYLYTGNGSTQTITNGIDLAGEGGLIWSKYRSGSSHLLYDTARGIDYIISTDTNGQQYDYSGDVTSVNSDGFSLGYYSGGVNYSGRDYATWTFRKAPKFFDVVTYTGDGVAGREISHNLGSVPGCIMIKQTTGTNNWIVYHRGANGGTNPEQYNLYLNLTNAQEDFILFDDTAPTATNFTVSNYTAVNGANNTYVAYVFAHNDGDGEFGPNGDADIIKCGSFPWGSTSGTEVNLGFEPQWILFKAADQAGKNWFIFDAMRGIVTGGFSGDGDAALFPNTTGAENVNTWGVDLTPTGFIAYGNNIASSGDIIYMAIRRGTKVPESGTEVFAVKRHAGADGPQPAGITSDMVITTQPPTASTERFNFNRLTNGRVLYTSQTFAEGNYSSYFNFNTNDGVNTAGMWGNTTLPIYYHFKRAPGYFDVVTYTGDGVAGRTVSHNLGVAPEMMWVKHRNNGGGWVTYAEPRGISKYLFLNSSGAETDVSSGYDFFYSTVPTATEFTVNSGYAVNSSGNQFIAYLFASLPGISKVGSYTGNGTSQTIDCGFTSGARFVLIKKTSSANGDWEVFDTERGINAGGDPELRLNDTNAEYAGYDQIDPDPSGFTVVNTNDQTNSSGQTYIFYAIA